MREWMKVLSLTKPVIQAPMAGGLVTPVLAAAVSNEGALGSLASGYLSPDMLEKQIIEMQQLTDRVFQVNVFVPESRKEPDEDIVQTWKNKIPFSEQAPSFSSEKEEWDDFHKKVNIILKHNVKACSFTFGIPPDESIQALKKNGCCLIGTATIRRKPFCLKNAEWISLYCKEAKRAATEGLFCRSAENRHLASCRSFPKRQTPFPFQ